MPDDFQFFQLQPFTLAGAGVTLGATSIILQSMTDIDGNLVTMADFGTIGFGTLEPGSGMQEEQICFTGITQNVNGTATLTGVSNVLFNAPYTQTSGVFKSHVGGTIFVISNTSGFYDRLTSKNDDETIEGDWTFTNFAPTIPTETSIDIHRAASIEYVNNTAVAGAPNASTTVRGIVQEATQAQVDAGTATGSTSARLYQNPSTIRAKAYNDYAADAGGTDAYAITVTPSISAYATGQVFTFKANTANTGTATLNVNALGAKTIVKSSNATLETGDILAGQIVQVVYDGTNMQLVSPSSNTYAVLTSVQNGSYTYAADAGGTDAYAITLSPAPAAYVTGMVVNFMANTANTAGATLNVNGLGAKTIVKNFNEALVTGDILAGQNVSVEYDGTNFQMLSSPANSGFYTSGVATPVDNTGGASVNVDTVITTNFTPRFIKLNYFLQAANAVTGYANEEGAVTYLGTSLQTRYVFRNTTASASDDAVPSTQVKIRDSSVPTLGGASLDGRQAVLSILSVSSTGFTIRVAITDGASHSGAHVRSQIIWEAWGY